MRLRTLHKRARRRLGTNHHHETIRKSQDWLNNFEMRVCRKRIPNFLLASITPSEIGYLGSFLVTALGMEHAVYSEDDGIYVHEFTPRDPEWPSIVE